MNDRDKIELRYCLEKALGRLTKLFSATGRKGERAYPVRRRPSAVSKVWHAQGCDMISSNFRNRGTLRISMTARVAERAKEGKTKKNTVAPSRAISTAHRAKLVAHNSDSVRLGSFPGVQYYHSYRNSDPTK